MCRHARRSAWVRGGRHGYAEQVAAHSLSDVEHGLADHPDGDQVVHCRVRVARREHAVAQLRGVEVVEAEFHRRIYLAHQDLVRRKLIVLLRRRPANGHVATIVLDRALAGLAHARKRRHPRCFTTLSDREGKLGALHVTGSPTPPAGIYSEHFPDFSEEAAFYGTGSGFGGSCG